MVSNAEKDSRLSYRISLVSIEKLRHPLLLIFCCRYAGPSILNNSMRESVPVCVALCEFCQHFHCAEHIQCHHVQSQIHKRPRSFATCIVHYKTTILATARVRSLSLSPRDSRRRAQRSLTMKEDIAIIRAYREDSNECVKNTARK